MKKPEVKPTPKEKVSVRINGVSIMVENNRNKTEADFVKELKHEWDNDEAKAKESFAEFKKAVAEMDKPAKPAAKEAVK